MSSNTEIRQKISDYLAGSIDAFDLEDCISADVWDALPSKERQLGYDALRLLSEASNGDWTDEELRLRLAKLAGILTDSGHSVSGDIPSLRAEGFLESLAGAEEAKAKGQSRESLLAIMRYAHVVAPKEGSSERAQPNDRAFLRQPKGENETPPQPPKELAAS